MLWEIYIFFRHNLGNLVFIGSTGPFADFEKAIIKARELYDERIGVVNFSGTHKFKSMSENPSIEIFVLPKVKN